MLQPLQSTLVSLSFPFEIFIAAFADGLVVVQTFLVRFTERLPVEPGVRYPLRILYSPNDWILQSYNMGIVQKTDSERPIHRDSEDTRPRTSNVQSSGGITDVYLRPLHVPLGANDRHRHLVHPERELRPQLLHLHADANDNRVVLAPLRLHARDGRVPGM